MNKPLELVCAWCTLVKEVNEHGVSVWPEPWIKDREFLGRNTTRYKEASHGICPECRIIHFTGVSK